MALNDRVMTGALGIIKKNGTVIGKMRNIRWSENFNRGDVQGIGTILKQEAPVLKHAGTWSCDFYEVDYKKTGIPDVIRRDVQTNQDFEDNIILNHDGVQVDIFKKVEDFIDPNTGLKKAKADTYAIIKRLLIDTEGADITEGVVSGHQQSGIFLDPIIYPV